MTAPDPLTLLVTTAQRASAAERDVNIAILSAKANGAGAVTFDRQACKGVGTYPKTEAFRPGRGGDRLRPVQARPLHQGRPHHPGAQRGLLGREAGLAARRLPPITSAGPRVAALLAGDVDLIENVPIQDSAAGQVERRVQGGRGLQPRHLSAFRLSRRAGAGRRYRRQEPVPRQARARGDLQGDRPRRHRGAHHGRRGGGGRRAAAAVLFGANKDMKAAKPDLDGAKKLLAGRLSERLLAGAGDAQRPLRQRRDDRPGGGADAHAGGAWRLARRHDPEPILPPPQQRDFGIWLAGWAPTPARWPRRSRR